MKFLAKYLLLLFAACGVVGWNSNADAQDSIRQRFDKKNISCKVTSVSAEEVAYESNGKAEKLPAFKVRMVLFGLEPRDFGEAKKDILEAKYKDALTAILNVSADSAADSIKQDIAFYRAYCEVQLAMRGEQGTLDGATDSLVKFIADHPTSYHHFEAIELLGDLYFRRGLYKESEEQYQLLASSPWQELKHISQVKVGRAAELQGKIQEAVAAYTAASGVETGTDEGRALVLAGKVGLARCEALNGNFEKGIQDLNQMIATESSSNQSLFGQIYTALGTCYVKADRPKDAVLAYLHVDLLYYQDSEYHAEALYNLILLFDKLGKVAEKSDCTDKLKTSYATSPWAQKLSAPAK